VDVLVVDANVTKAKEQANAVARLTRFHAQRYVAAWALVAVQQQR
jgi:hypothetical protein